jgi:hypothetical protein
MIILSDQAGTITFPEGDSPEQMPMPASLQGQAQSLGDGTRLYAATGWQLGDLRLSGVMREREGGTTPLGQLHALQDMAQRQYPVRLVWRGDGSSQTWENLLITDLQLTVVGHNDVEYQLTLFQNVTGVLSAASPSSSIDQAAANSARARAIAPSAGSRSTAASNKVGAAEAFLNRR